LGKIILALDSLQSTHFSIFLFPARILAIKGILCYGETIAFARVINYLTAQYFGNVTWVMLTEAFATAIIYKYKIFLLDLIRSASGRTILPASHSIEVVRRLELILSDSREEDQIIELVMDHTISNLERQSQIIRYRRNHLTEQSHAPNENEVLQLQKHISQLEKQIQEHPEDESIKRFHANAIDRLKKILRNKEKAK